MTSTDVMQPANRQFHLAGDLAASTSSATSQPRRLRSVGAVAAGLVGIFAVTTAVDAVMHATRVFPPLGSPPMSDALFLLAFAYRFVIDVAGSWLAARLAPRRPMRHAMVLGAIGTVLSIAGAVAMWDASRAWYPLALAGSAFPCAWLGGRLVRRRASPA
ncbi:MAG TPA: hypothetical protein VFH68_12300 [Polyangia bacterium]|jgi:hypothetical protein|nr:hypothetical protein [Polyangia bacterium]